MAVGYKYFIVDGSKEPIPISNTEYSRHSRNKSRAIFRFPYHTETHATKAFTRLSAWTGAIALKETGRTVLVRLGPSQEANHTHDITIGFSPPLPFDRAFKDGIAALEVATGSWLAEQGPEPDPRVYLPGLFVAAPS